MEEWKEYKLGEVSNISTGFAFSGKKYSKEGIRVVRGDNITIGKLRWPDDKDKRWNEPFERLAEFSLQEGDIVVGMDGSRVGKNRAQIRKEDLPLLIAQRVACIRRNNLSCQKYLYYLIFSDYFESYVAAIHTGTSIPHISLKQIADLPVRLPSLSTQRKIACILSSLDDKIELNRRINTNLEEQAQALFKSWFIDFEPFKDGKFVDSELGMIPEGWKVGSIGDYCKVRSGFAFKSSWWTTEGVKVVKIKNITGDGQLDMNDCSFVNECNTLKAQDFKAKSGDLLIAMTGATIGKFCLVPPTKERLYVNQRVGKFFIGTDPICKLPFIHGCLKTQRVYQEIINKGQGSAQPNVSGGDIESVNIILPSVDIIAKFNSLLQPLYQLLLSNVEEMETLKESRDTLLPKLMSGEIEI